LVRELNPLPSTPDVIEPLGPALARPSMTPTWEQFAAALAPSVRELPAGERPGDWVKTDDESVGHTNDNDSVNVDCVAVTEDSLPVGPVPVDLPPVTGPQLFQVQFGTAEEHVRLVERAKALLARTRPRITLGELHLEAMKHLVATLEKRKFAVTERPRSRLEAVEGGERLEVEPRQRGEVSGGEGGERLEPRQRLEAVEGGERLEVEPRQRGDIGAQGEPSTEPSRQRAAPLEDGQRGRGKASGKRDASEEGESSTEARQRGRYIPAAVRREVYRRDGARCTYVDARGLRCAETRYLELHHLRPFALNGAHEVSNLALRCAAHNALAAEEDFGRSFVTERRRSSRHEAFARHHD
jgi:hypothetical protein